MSQRLVASGVPIPIVCYVLYKIISKQYFHEDYGKGMMDNNKTPR